MAAFTEFASIAEDLNQVVQTLLLTNDSYVAPEIIRPLEDMGEELDFHALKMVNLSRRRYDPQFNGDLGEYLHGLESPGQRFTSLDYPSLIERFCEKWVRVLDAIAYTLEGDYILHYKREGGLGIRGPLPMSLRSLILLSRRLFITLLRRLITLLRNLISEPGTMAPRSSG